MRTNSGGHHSLRLGEFLRTFVQGRTADMKYRLKSRIQMLNLRGLHYGYLLFASVFVVGSIIFRYIELHAGIGNLALVSIAIFLLYMLIVGIYGLLFIWSALQGRKVALSIFGGMVILFAIF